MFPDLKQSNGSAVDPDDALESRKIPLQTIIPDGVITAGDAKNVRFDFSKKNGYSPKQVDKYVFEVVSQSLEFYSRKLESRDRDVHRLGKDLNEAEIDNQRLKRQLEFADSNSLIAESIGRAKTDSEFEALMNEVTKLRSQVEAYQAENPEAAHAAAVNDSVISQEQLNVLNQTLEEYRAALDAHEQNAVYYESQIQTLTEERDTYHAQASEYYQQTVALQQKMDNYSEDQSTALYETSKNLGRELEELKAAKTEVDNNYALVYNELEKLQASIPESGIVAADTHTQLQVEYDTLQTKFADAEEREQELQAQVASLQKGTLAGSGAITEEDYNALHMQAEELQKSFHSLEAKYAVLLGQKQAQDEIIDNLKAQLDNPAQNSVSNELPDGYIPQSDYDELHAQATANIEAYNQLTDEYNELYEQYEAFIAQVQASGGAFEQEAPQAQESVQIEQTQEQYTPTPVESAPINSGSKYQNKKLPEGIRPEDLE